MIFDYEVINIILAYPCRTKLWGRNLMICSSKILPSKPTSFHSRKTTVSISPSIDPRDSTLSATTCTKVSGFWSSTPTKLRKSSSSSSAEAGAIIHRGMIFPTSPTLTLSDWPPYKRCQSPLPKVLRSSVRASSTLKNLSSPSSRERSLGLLLLSWPCSTGFSLLMELSLMHRSSP